jgi:hypothetical protein
MRNASEGIGNLLEVIDNLHLLEDSTILLVPDHGHRAVEHTTDLRNIGAWLGGAIGTQEILINPLFKIDPVRHDEFVVLTSGDSAVYVYPPASPTDEYLIDLASNLVGSGNFEFMVAALSENRHLVISSDGSGIIEGNAEALFVNYRTLSGIDPLGMKSNETVDLSDLRLQDQYPDFIAQYLNSIVLGRSAPLLGFAKRGHQFGWGTRLGWRFGNHRGSHGGPLREEVLVSGIAMSNTSPRSDSWLRSRDFLRAFGALEMRPTRLKVGKV